MNQSKVPVYCAGSPEVVFYIGFMEVVFYNSSTQPAL